MQNNAYTNHAVGPVTPPPYGETTSPVQPRLPQPEDFIASNPPLGIGGTPVDINSPKYGEMIKGLIGSGGPEGTIADLIGGLQPKQAAPKLYPSRDVDINALAEGIMRGMPDRQGAPSRGTPAPMPPVSEAISKMPELSRAMGSNDYANPFQSFRKNISAVTQKMANLDLGEEYMSRIFGGQKPEQFFNNVTNVFGQTWGELGNRMTALETLSKKRGG